MPTLLPMTLVLVVILTGCGSQNSSPVATQASLSPVTSPVAQAPLPQVISPAPQVTAPPAPPVTTPATAPTLAPSPPTPVPTATTVPTASFSSPELALSLRYPAGWFLESSASGPTIKIMNRESLSGGTDVLPPGTVLFMLAPKSGPAPADGTPFQVGTEGYPGTMVHLASARQVNRGITIDYQAMGTAWQITGMFGDPADDTNPNYTQFLAITQSIRHTGTARLAPTTTPDYVRKVL